MDKLHLFLMEWALGYVKNRDIIKRNIKNIVEGKEGFLVNFKDKDQKFIIKPFLDNMVEVINKIGKEDHVSIVMFNSVENFKIVVNNWNKLVEFINLSIYFVNPFSHLDKRWVIYPHTHHKISDKDSFELGLKTMFEMVGAVSKKELESKVS